jgi:hypothetical protein
MEANHHLLIFPFSYDDYDKNKLIGLSIILFI